MRPSGSRDDLQACGTSATCGPHPFFGTLRSLLPPICVVLSSLLLSGCFFLDSKPNLQQAVGTPALVAERHPVVVLADGLDAAVMSRARVDEDPAKPVQQFLQAYNLVSGPQRSPLQLAGPTASNFVASGRPDVSGQNDSLATSPGGWLTTLWLGDDAGSLNLYANVGRSDGMGGRVALATGLTASTPKRIAAAQDRALAVWQSSADLRARVWENATGWGDELRLPATELSATWIGDAAIADATAWVVWSNQGNAVSVSRYRNRNWEPPIRIGTSAAPQAPRVAWNPAALGFEPVFVWSASDGLRYNRILANGSVEHADGALIAGAEGITSDVSMTMSANGDVMLVFRGVGGGSRYSNGVWSPVPLALDGSLRVASCINVSRAISVGVFFGVTRSNPGN